MLIKKERNGLVHLKKIEELILPTAKDLKRLEAAFQDYYFFINKIANGLFIGCYRITEEQTKELIAETELKGITLKELIIKPTMLVHL